MDVSARLRAALPYPMAHEAGPVWQELLDGLGAGLQETANLLHIRYAAQDLATATGEDLDRLGELLGLPRGGMSDTAYRGILAVMAVALGSQGSYQSVWAMAQEAERVGIARQVHKLVQVAQAAVSLQTFGGQDAYDALHRFQERIERALVGGGVKFYWVVGHQDETDTFVFGNPMTASTRLGGSIVE